MTRPHERLGLPQPIGRRLPTGVVSWNIVIAVITVILAVVYIVQVNRAATQGFALRDAAKEVEAKRTQVTSLADDVAVLSSVQAMSERANQMGYIPVERLEFVNPASKSYALK